MDVLDAAMRLTRRRFRAVAIGATSLLVLSATFVSPLAIVCIIGKIPKFAHESTRDLGYMSYPGEPLSRFWIIESLPLATVVFVKSATEPAHTIPVSAEALTVQQQRLPRWSVAREPWCDLLHPRESPNSPETAFVEIAAGFPFRSLLLRVRGQVPDLRESSELGKIAPKEEPGIFPSGENGEQMDERIVHGFYYCDAPQAGDLYRTLASRVLPTHIIWSGMVGNFVFFTLFLGSPCWFGMLRRWRRARSGRCVHCGYSIAGLSSEKCPECGWEVAVRATRSS